MVVPKADRTDDSPSGTGARPVDSDLEAAIGALQSGSVLAHIESRAGDAPHVALPDSSANGPLIDPTSVEKLALPLGRGTYRLLGEIAKGGMGVVLKGHDVDLGRDVAVKVLHKDLAGRPEVLHRFIEEAQIGGQLQHPGIVPVYELGLLADERPYFTMKLVKGRTLAMVLAERESPATDSGRMLDVFLSMCQTAAYAHSRGVIHRDLKPANVMVGAFGEVQIVDWGLAKVLARGGTADERRAREARPPSGVLETVRSDGTHAGTDSMLGSVMGTPAYMSPEQARGKVDELDERSDVFSLGAILCEILTGIPPYGDEHERTLLMAAGAELDGAVARLEACGADSELVTLTLSCLRPVPSARPRHAGVLAERIQGHLESLEERGRTALVDAAEARVREEEARVRVRQERKARRLTLVLSAAVVGLLVVVGGGWLRVSNERAVLRQQEEQRRFVAAERERALIADVDQALDHEARLRGSGRWDEALAAVDRALGLAEGGGAGVELLERIEVVRASVRKSADLARERTERGQSAERLSRALRDVGSTIEFAGFAGAMPILEEEYSRIFAEHGLAIDAMTPAEVADVFLAGRIGADVAAAVDNWILVRNTVANEIGGVEAAEWRARALHLADIARELDPDRLHTDLRRALIHKDVGMLLRIAEGDLDEQPATTLALLGTALDQVNWPGRGLRVLRDGVHRHPDAFPLRMALVQALQQDIRIQPWDEERGEELSTHLSAALALQPGNGYLRAVLHWQLRGMASHRLRNGDLTGGRELMYEAARSLQATMASSKELHRRFPEWLGQTLWYAGLPDEALAALLDGIECFPQQIECRYEAANVLIELRRLDEAEALLEDALALQPENLDLESALVACRVLAHMMRGDVPAVLETIDAALPEEPTGRAGLLNNVGWQVAFVPPEGYLTGTAPMSDAERARFLGGLRTVQAEVGRLVEEAVEIEPWNPLYWNTLGLVRYRSGDPEGAIAAIEKGLELTGSPHGHDWSILALAHHDLGHGEEAQRCYEQALTGNERLSGAPLNELPSFWAEVERKPGLQKPER